MDHDARVRQREALALGAGGQQESTHRCGQARAQGRDVRLDEVHRVEDRQARRDRTARRVDVERDVLVRILAFQEQQLGHDEVGHLVVDRTDQEDHALFQQARVDVVGALAAAALLDHHRHEAEGLGIQCRITIHTCHYPLRKVKGASGASPPALAPAASPGPLVAQLYNGEPWAMRTVANAARRPVGSQQGSEPLQGAQAWAALPISSSKPMSLVVTLALPST